MFRTTLRLSRTISLQKPPEFREFSYHYASSLASGLVVASLYLTFRLPPPLFAVRGACPDITVFSGLPLFHSLSHLLKRLYEALRVALVRCGHFHPRIAPTTL